MNFNVIIDRLAKWPRTQRIGLYGALYALLFGLYAFFGYIPVNGRISDLKTEQQTLLQQLAAIQLQVDQREAFRERLRELMDELKVALRELPENREIPGLLRSIDKLGKNVGLEVRRFQPLDENVRQYVAEVPVALEVEGDYHQVASFFDRLSKMNRIVYVEDIEMSNPVERGGNIYLTVTGKVVTFRFLSDEEIEANRANNERSKAKGKRGRG